MHIDNDYIIGGFTTIKWEKGIKMTADPECFLFNLNLEMKCPVKKECTDRAMYVHTDGDFDFGFDGDLSIKSYASSKTNIG